MTIDPVTMAAAGVAAPQPAPVGTAPVTEFGEWLRAQVAITNGAMLRADDGVRRLALGETDNLHQVMIQLERARLSFELVVQVRNKLLDAYQELLRMQV